MGNKTSSQPELTISHEHPLRLVKPGPEHWRCDSCKKLSLFNTKLRRQDRYRCSDGCDFDLCLDCHSTNFLAEATMSSSPASVPQTIGRGRCSKNLGAWGSVLAAATALEKVEGGSTDKPADARRSQASEQQSSEAGASMRRSMSGRCSKNRGAWGTLLAAASEYEQVEGAGTDSRRSQASGTDLRNLSGRCSKNRGAWGTLLAAAEQLEQQQGEAVEDGHEQGKDTTSRFRASVIGEAGNRRSGFSDITVLHEAAMDGDVSRVSECLSQGETVNIRTDAGNTPLGFAVVHGHLAVTQYLLNARSDVNGSDHLGATPLHSAAEHGYASIAAALLAAGAEVNAADIQSKTPLHEAARNGHKPLALVLIPAGADVNAKCHSGYTPLAMAEDWGTVEMADFLKSRGAGRYVDRYGPAQ
eukprot:gnl/TRDRNA2_/TRDRNA2_177608_c3_seq19.p1 gnl/TRDRNA2_/TRDRNA2_177608_c3~~gnl/TRDRNA2_/TRDRNA2_177608_c3_seq19.p1  ORF type:complete len:415 (+),score=70.28 gnl/TRDRNA2_/TRDRNA2_177608_c3_seq19:93-1337(+)